MGFEPRRTPSILGFPHRPEWGPVAHRRAVAGYLRNCREHARISPRHVADCIGVSESTVSRMETGQSVLRPLDVERLMRACGVTDQAEYERAARLTDEAGRAEPWQQYGQVVPRWVRPLLGMELAAQRILSYEPQLVPGWLQTPEYAEIVIRSVHPTASRQEIDTRVQVRVERLEMFRRQLDPPVLLAVMDEGVFTRQVGSPGTMRRQVRHLLNLLEELPYQLRLQIASQSVGAAGVVVGHPVVHLRFHAADHLPDMVYLEQFEGATYYEKPADTERYQAVMNNLCGLASPYERTRTLLAEAATHVW